MMNIVWSFMSPILAGFIIISNIIEIIIIARLKGKLQLSMIYILNLSISDLLVGVITIAIKIVYFSIENNRSLVYNKPLVEFYFVLLFLFLRLSLVVSVLNLMAITVDRILAVCKPLWYRNMKQVKAICVCICLWLAATTVLAIYYCGIRFDWISQQAQAEYELLLFPMVTLPTALTLALCYYFIILKLNVQRRKIYESGLHFQREMTVEQLITFSPVRTIYERKRIKKEWRIIKLAISVVLAYLLCWLPLSIYGLVKASGVHNTESENILFLIAILNSLLDPILYLHHIRNEIRKFARNAFRHIVCIEQSSDPEMQSDTQQGRSEYHITNAQTVSQL